MERILIKNGRVWDGEKMLFADVLTEGGVVAKIQKDISTDAAYVYDAAGGLVSAGLVDLHVHMKGVAPDEFGIDPQMSCFPFGVTAANDAGSLYGSRLLLDSFAVKNTVFAGVEIKNNRPELTAAEKLLEKYGDRAIGLKVYFDTALASEDVVDAAPLRKICSYAKSSGLKVMVHCSNSPVPMAEIVDILSAGDILTHIFHGGKNPCTENGFEAFRLARQKGVVMDAGFAGHVHTDFGNLQKAVGAGFLPDTISTDITCRSAFKRGGRYGMTLCMNLAGTAGMREEDILRAVTSAPAKALGKEKEWGRLKEGGTADIAVFGMTDEGFVLTDAAGGSMKSTKGYRCVLTVADGQVVYRD